MALDVQTSLANALFANERTASTKARGNGKTAAKTRINAAALDNAPSRSVPPHRFDTLVSEKASASTGPQKAAAAASSPRTRGTMPGRIAGHQDTVVTPRENAAKALNSDSVEASSKPDGEKQKAAAERKPDGAGCERAQNPEAPGVTASGQDETAQTQTEEAGPDQQATQQEGGEHTGQDTQKEPESGTELSAEVAAGDAVPASVIPEGVTVVAGAAVVNTPTPTGPVLASQGDETLSVGGVTEDGSAATPLVGATGTDGSTAQTLAGAPEGAMKAKATPERTDALQNGAPQDLDVQAGMTEHGEANAARIAEAAAEGTLAKGSKAAKGTGEGALESKFGHTLPGEGPTLRGSVFTQVLSDFAGEHGVNRMPDLLSGLDRSVAAAAQANRGADVQRPTPLQMLPLEIGMQAVRGAREFQIRLDPAELGRVDVKLQINDKGEVNASLVVERPETLQMLRRDATTLAQAFEQAGLKQGENALSFSLKGENQQGQQQHAGRNHASVQDSEDAALQAQIGEIAMRRVMIPNSSLDLMV